MAMNGSFGEALRQLRRKAGVSQRELAERIGFDYTSVSKFENGQRVPSADTVLALCEVLGAPGDRLLALVGKVPSEVEKAVATSRQAQSFLREAHQMGLSDSEWKTLRCCLSHLRNGGLALSYDVANPPWGKSAES